MKLEINGVSVEAAVPAETPLLWVVREEAGLTGTKYGCGRALCGACTVLVDGEARRSCVVAAGDVAGKKVTTVEGLADNGVLSALQEAWLAENVPQCGYCQSGQLMSATALLAKKREPTDADVDAVMSANLCRCGTYPRIRAAIKRAVTALVGKP
ncbi:MAG: (2Fe-2S)-binding protein [Labilithrix sp.]|nr:(2Fe-2S)-binding protein [Labilithrix sp.]